MSSSRFDLEKAIAAWRRPFEHTRALSSEDLEELEGSLRDRVEALVEAGLTEEVAFREALRRMGSYSTAEIEYRKVYWGKLRRRTRLIHELRWSVSMLKNYLRIALRNLLRHKGYTFINIAGLAIGVACCLSILLYVRDELSYDRYHEKREHIFRLVSENQMNQEIMHNAGTPAPWAPILQSEYPEVFEYVRFMPAESDVLVSRGDRRFYEHNFFFADSSVFDVFSWNLVAGAPATALVAPYSVVVTEGFARKYFGEAAPLNQSIIFNDTLSFQITGIMEDVPTNSHFRFDFLVSFSSLERIFGEVFTAHMRWSPFYTYLVLPEGYNPAQLEAKLPAFIDRYVAEGARARNITFRPYLQPLTAIHLRTEMENEIAPQGDLTYIYLFSVIGFIILLIAAVNFVNLTTARVASRTREVGVRKVVGAGRGQLIRQFLSESILLSSFALMLAFLIVFALLPFLNALTARDLRVTDLGPGLTVAVVLGFSLLLGSAAGAYPAFFLTSFTPVDLARGLRSSGRQGGATMLRRGLVVFQFAATVVLIVGTVVVFKQLRFMQNEHLGFAEEHVLVLPLNSGPLTQQVELIRNALDANPHVVSVSAASGLPGLVVGGDLVRPEGAPADEVFPMDILAVDTAFLGTLGVELVAGTNLPRTAGGLDHINLLLNETAVSRLELKTATDAIGKRLSIDVDYTGTVTGVIRDFHARSFRERIGPLMLTNLPQFNYVAVRLEPGQIARSLESLQTSWRQHFPDFPFEYMFLDEEFDRLYQAEARLGKIYGTFSILATLIACLGLFGLMAYVATQRTKEIGIRKALGATIPDIAGLLSVDFLKLVGIAYVVAVPVAYFLMHRWLSGFAYHIAIGPGLFLLTGGLVLLIALLTVSYQAIKAALTDPVKSLRYE